MRIQCAQNSLSKLARLKKILWPRPWTNCRLCCIVYSQICVVHDFVHCCPCMWPVRYACQKVNCSCQEWDYPAQEFQSNCLRWCQLMSTDLFIPWSFPLHLPVLHLFVLGHASLPAVASQPASHMRIPVNNAEMAKGNAKFDSFSLRCKNCHSTNNVCRMCGFKSRYKVHQSWELMCSEATIGIVVKPETSSSCLCCIVWWTKHTKLRKLHLRAAHKPIDFNKPFSARWKFEGQ